MSATLALPPPSPPAINGFVLFINALRRAIFEPRRGGLAAGPLTIVVWRRLNRIATRFVALIAQVRAGAILSSARPRRSASSAATRPTGSPNLPRPNLPRPPNDFGWLVRLAPVAASYRGQLQHLLSNPEIASLLSAAPQLGQALRPLCHMLAIRLPKPQAVSAPVQAPKPHAPEQAPIVREKWDPSLDTRRSPDRAVREPLRLPPPPTSPPPAHAPIRRRSPANELLRFVLNHPELSPAELEWALEQIVADRLRSAT
jgi:hypothetical protein